MKIHTLKSKSVYKKQKKFVVCDCGKIFKNRYGVVGLPVNLANKTKYFKRQEEAVEYFLKEIAVFKKKIPVIKADSPLESMALSSRKNRAFGKSKMKKVRNKDNGKEFDSISLAEEFYRRRGLRAHLVGKSKHFAGFQWEYVT